MLGYVIEYELTLHRYQAANRISIKVSCVFHSYRIHLMHLYIVAMKSQEAESMYAQFLDKLGKAYDPNRIKNGQFGALMDVELVNDGPVTITIDTTELIATNSNGK